MCSVKAAHFEIQQYFVKRRKEFKYLLNECNFLFVCFVSDTDIQTIAKN